MDLPPLKFRTPGPWGTGINRPLSWEEIDNNFHNLNLRITALEGRRTPQMMEQFDNRAAPMDRNLSGLDDRVKRLEVEK